MTNWVLKQDLLLSMEEKHDLYLHVGGVITEPSGIMEGLKSCKTKLKK